MGKLVINEAKKLTEEYYTVFSGVYNDFRLHSADEYKFELEPLEYNDFLESLKSGLIDCYILLEDNIPTGFLAYTTAISDSLELNIIHCIGSENINQKRHILVSKFLEDNKDLTKKMVVSYPMMGNQREFVPYLTHFGFKFVNIAVTRFDFTNPVSTGLIKKVYPQNTNYNYTLRPWRKEYFNEAAKLIHEIFHDTSDALFDSRFKSYEGSADVLQKVVSGYYGEFLPDIMRLAFEDNKMCGICLANVTTGTIANIPLFGLAQKHRGKGLGKFLLTSVIHNLLNEISFGKYNLTEINVSVETDNTAGVKMYRHAGFREDYSYPQAYLPVSGG